MLGVTNRGTGRLPALGDRTVLPFSDTAPGKRVAGSHEPAMRIGADEHNETTVVVLELPTGASCRVSQLDSEQAQRFAADPAKMTAASRGLRAAAAEQAARRETRR
jgi:hypothetical protein